MNDDINDADALRIFADLIEQELLPVNHIGAAERLRDIANRLTPTPPSRHDHARGICDEKTCRECAPPVSPTCVIHAWPFRMSGPCMTCGAAPPDANEIADALNDAKGG